LIDLTFRKWTRKANAVKLKDAHHMNDGILSRLPIAEYITSLDLKYGFWQFPLDTN